MEPSGTEWNRENERLFVCNLCDFKCSYKSDWTRHLSTSKHFLSHNGIENGTEESILAEKNERYFCVCGRSYSSKSNLGKHKKSCASHIKDTVNAENESKLDIYDLVKYLMKENSELKHMVIDQSNKMLEQNNKLLEQSNSVVMELAKSNINNTTNNTINHNSNNKAFNLNFFLNETCKNAMNITDFVDSIKLQLSDLISVGELGYVEGISNIIVKNLNALDETERPIHCTDKKRETIYIKDENKWEKDDDDKKKLRKMINRVAYKNQNMFPKFKEQYPDYNDAESKRSDQYSKIVVESMGDSDKEKQDKIIKRISKEVCVDK
jgi:hypothetical protein